jgi:hypothetical protein
MEACSASEAGVLALRPRDACKALGMSPRLLFSLTSPRGPIPAVRVGHGKLRSVLYPVDSLKAWLAEQAAASRGRQQ